MLCLGVALWIGVPQADAAPLELKTFCAQNHFRLDSDAVSKNVVLSGPFGTMSLHPGCDFFLYNGQLKKFQKKPKRLRDSWIIPDEATASFIALTRARPASAEVVGESPTVPVYRFKKVVLDAGHGGKDLGAVSIRGTKEKELTLAMARRVADALRANGIEVVLTRGTDVFVSLSDRARMANASGADLFVSIHANASLTRSLNGFEVYTLSEATDDLALAVERAENSSLNFENGRVEKPGKDLKTIVWDLREAENRKESIRVAQKITTSVSDSVWTACRRIRTANFFVLKWTELPAVLVEIGYISNPQDDLRLKDATYAKDLAEAIAKGVLKYKDQFEASDGFTR